MYATVQELVDALTPEEKAGLCTGAAVPRLGLPALRVNGLHSQERSEEHTSDSSHITISYAVFCLKKKKKTLTVKYKR